MKKFFITLGVLFLLFVLAARIVPSFISEERIKKVVITKAEEILGHNILINGKLRFKVFPVAGVYMEDVTLGKHPEKDEKLASFKSMNVDVETLALINGNVIIKSLTVEEPVINLVIDKNGNQNWAPTKKKPDEIYVSSPNKAEDKKDQKVQAISLEDVRIQKGTITYTDESNGQTWEAKNVNVKVHLDDMDSPFEVDGKLDLNNRTINFKTTLSTLKSFTDKNRADIEARVKSDLLNFDAKGVLDGAGYTGSTSLNSPSLTQATVWLTKKPLGAQFSSAFTLELESQTTCTPDMCQFNKANFTLDSLKGNGDVKALFNKKLPTIEAQLNTNVIDLNLFMTKPAQAHSFSIISSAHAAQGWSTEPMNFAALRNLNLVVGINAEGVKVQNIEMGKTLFRAKIDRGTLSTDIVDAAFYGGKATVIASVNASGKTPTIKKRVDLNNVDMNAFLQAADVTDRFSGTGDFTFNMASAGNNQHDIISAMDGNGTFKARDGKIKGFNIAQMIRNVQSAFKDVDTSEQSTDFSELIGSFSINNGIISNQDLMMKAPLLRASGKGTINLPQKTINYRITPEVVQTAQGQDGKEKQGVGVPIIVTGSLEKPRFAPDLAGTVKDVLKDPAKYKGAIKDVKQELKNLKQDKGAIKDLLGGFIKKKEQPAPEAQTPADPAQ